MIYPLKILIFLCSFHLYQVEGQNFVDLTTILQPPPPNKRFLPSSYQNIFWTWIFPDLVFHNDGILCGWVFRGKNISSRKSSNMPLWRVYEFHSKTKYRIRRPNNFKLVPFNEDGVYQYLLVSPIYIKADDVVGIRYKRNPFENRNFLQVAFIDEGQGSNGSYSYRSDNKENTFTIGTQCYRCYYSTNRYIPMATPLLYYAASSSVNAQQCSSFMKSQIQFITKTAKSSESSIEMIISPSAAILSVKFTPSSSEMYTNNYIFPTSLPASTLQYPEVHNELAFPVYGTIAGIVVVGIIVAILILFLLLLIRFKVKKNVHTEITLDSTLHSDNIDNSNLLPPHFDANVQETSGTNQSDRNDTVDASMAENLEEEAACSEEYYDTSLLPAGDAMKYKVSGQMEIEDINTPTKVKMIKNVRKFENVYSTEYYNVNPTSISSSTRKEGAAMQSGASNLATATMISDKNYPTSSVSCKHEGEYCNSTCRDFNMKLEAPKSIESPIYSSSEEEDEYSYVRSATNKVVRSIDGNNGYY